MVTSFEVPDNYGYVLLTCGILPAIITLPLAGRVMTARKKYDVQYPNLYATPGYHKEADAFNRVQRGHQKTFETLSDFRILSLIGGLAHPLTCAGAGILYNLGNYLYMAGYADNKLDVKTARMKKGGPINILGLLISLVCATKFSLSLIK
jgi:glutathione S-transferase